MENKMINHAAYYNSVNDPKKALNKITKYLISHKSLYFRNVNQKLNYSKNYRFSSRMENPITF